MSRETYYVIHLARVLTELPLVVVKTIDEYLRVYCDCGVNVFPDQLHNWNVSEWHDLDQLTKSKCGQNDCDSYQYDELPIDIECLMNREVQVGDDGTGSFWIRVKAFGTSPHYLHWSVQVRSAEGSKSHLPHKFCLDGEHPTRCQSFTIRNEYTLQTLKMIAMTDTDLNRCWNGSLHPGRDYLHSTVNIRACLVKSLDYFFDL